MLLKYTQEELNNLEDFFASQVGENLFKVYHTGNFKGVRYVSGAGLSNKEKRIVDEFCEERYGREFKLVQTAFNKRIRSGHIRPRGAANVDTQPKEIIHNQHGMVNTIVRLSRLVADKHMTASEFEEVISNLYS